MGQCRPHVLRPIEVGDANFHTKVYKARLWAFESMRVGVRIPAKWLIDSLSLAAVWGAPHGVNEWAAAAPGLPRDYFAPAFASPLWRLRFNRYPAKLDGPYRDREFGISPQCDAMRHPSIRAALSHLASCVRMCLAAATLYQFCDIFCCHRPASFLNLRTYAATILYTLHTMCTQSLCTFCTRSFCGHRPKASVPDGPRARWPQQRRHVLLHDPGAGRAGPLRARPAGIVRLQHRQLGAPAVLGPTAQRRARGRQHEKWVRAPLVPGALLVRAFPPLPPRQHSLAVSGPSASPGRH
jgi:hypothetical protein